MYVIMDAKVAEPSYLNPGPDSISRLLNILAASKGTPINNLIDDLHLLRKLPRMDSRTSLRVWR